MLKLGEQLNVIDGCAKEEGGKIHIGGTAQTQYQKDQIWDEIKRVGGDSPSDVVADIRVL